MGSPHVPPLPPPALAAAPTPSLSTWKSIRPSRSSQTQCSEEYAAASNSHCLFRLRAWGCGWGCPQCQQERRSQGGLHCWQSLLLSPQPRPGQAGSTGVLAKEAALFAPGTGVQGQPAQPGVPGTLSGVRVGGSGLPSRRLSSSGSSQGMQCSSNNLESAHSGAKSAPCRPG